MNFKPFGMEQVSDDLEEQKELGEKLKGQGERF